MSTDLQQLVADTVELTGVDAPSMLAPDAPTLDVATPREEMYLVGLIGGKDVGKSSLVNALVGREITKRTSFGEGTGTVIAYAHESVASPLRELLQREVPDKFSIVTHNVRELSRQVLLDLPDIDSHWQQHVQITRRMLRHLLYPIWVQSIEKYADAQPQDLLRQVAAGNDPANFLFCLNKADQLIAREGTAAANELRSDYARRISVALKLPNEPRVYLATALDAASLDLPELRRTLSNQRSTSSVEQSIQLAGNRRHETLVRWLDDQRLSERASRANRALRDAEELVASRLVDPLLDEVIPRIGDDPAHRVAMIEPVMSARLGRWPIVNVINGALSPVASLVKRSLSPSARPLVGSDASIPLIDVHLRELTGSRTLASMVRTTFAQLRQVDPDVARLYEHHRYWDDAPAESAAARLGQSLGATLARQRDLAMRTIGKRSGPREMIFAPLRWLLTIGALLWFPLVQPLLERYLVSGLSLNLHDLATLIVPLLGATYLLHSATFLIIWFAALWLLLRWDTNRRANRLLRRWTLAAIESDVSLPGAVARWTDELLEPIKRRADEASALSKRIDEARALVSAN